jgi:hypothetical protein
MSAPGYVMQNSKTPRNMSQMTSRLVSAGMILVFACTFAVAQSPSGLPQVHLDADGLAPRSIEELTGTTIAKNYAKAWRDLASALDSSRSGEIADGFTGFAKDRLVRRIGEQQQTGVHVHIVDHGHQLKAIFYSADGSVMQLVDQAQLEIQTFDGGKLLDTQNASRQYMVLMTPGADRWYIRDLEEVSVPSK